MRVAVEISALSRAGRQRGLGRYVRACWAAAGEAASSCHPIALPARSGRTAEFRDLAQRMTMLARERDGVFHATHPMAWAPCHLGTVTSILDLIPFDVADYRKTGVKNRLFFSRAARSASVLTISQFSAERAVEVLGVCEERIIVAPLYPAESLMNARAVGDAPRDAMDAYVVCVVDLATYDPRKRGRWIAPIANRLRKAGMRLVVAGAATDRADLGSAVGVGQVADERLAELIRGAACFLYFSAYEGQGMPPLEAMALGTPVVATDNTAIGEVIGDGGLLIQERDEAWRMKRTPTSEAATQSELVDACVALRDDDSARRELRERGRARAALFSRESFTTAVKLAYGRAACS